MNIFGFLMTLSFGIYMYLGIYVLCRDRKAKLNRVFFALCISYGLWALASCFSNSADSKDYCYIWGIVASIGYCTFASLALHFFLLYTKKYDLLKKRWLYLIIYLPCVIFIYQSLKGNLFVKDYALGEYGWYVLMRTDSVYFWLFIMQILVYGTTSLLLCYFWWKSAPAKRDQKQAKIIFITAVISFFLCFFLEFIPRITGMSIPDMTPVGFVVWISGIVYGIAKYNLMLLTPSLAVENILQTISDSVILVDLNGVMITANQETIRLLKYDINELIGKPLSILFHKDNDLNPADLINLLRNGPIRNIETFFITKNGEKIPINFSASFCRDDDETIIGFVAVAWDITSLKNTEERLRNLAHHDVLTNLANRLLLDERLSHDISVAQSNNKLIAVVLFDIDRFKDINDVYGHNIGDLLLIEIAKRLKTSVRLSDTIARLGGDEFVILLNGLNQANDFEATVQMVMKHLSEPYFIDTYEINITVSMGISIYPIHGGDLRSLLKHADIALYKVKSQGKNNYQLYSAIMSSVVNEKMELENSLRKALANDELFLEYQTIIDTDTGLINGVEALLRWNHPEYGIIPPLKFIPLAEESGLIVPIGEWVLRTACLEAKKWQESGFPHILLSVNLSPIQFKLSNILSNILQILKETKFEPEYLMLEITESAAMNDYEKTNNILKQFQDHKIKVAIDDFGTGYSSLVYLKKMPIYAIKIDRLFIKDIQSDPDCIAIVTAMIAMAHSMRLKVIIEGIENDEQLIRLNSLKWEYVGSPICDATQGYLFSRPVEGKMIEDLLKKDYNDSKNEKLYPKELDN